MPTPSGLRRWAELSTDEQLQFQLRYACTRDLMAAANELKLSHQSARQIVLSRNMDAMADRADEILTERVAETAATWKERAIGKVDELLGWLDQLRSFGQINKPSVSDYDKLYRLMAFLYGEADSRTEVQGEVADVSAREQLAGLLAGMRARGEAAADTGDAD